MTIHRENLIVALNLAIIFKKELEIKQHGIGFESTFVAGLKEVRDALNERKEVEIIN